MSALRILELEIGDEPDAWRAAGFTVATDGIASVGSVRIRCTGDSGARGIRGWTISGFADGDSIDGGSLDGLATTVVGAAAAPPAAAGAAAHANTVTILDHVVLATPDIDRTVGAFVALGCVVRRERIGGSEAAPLRQVFLRAGEVVLEIVGPPNPPERDTDRARPATFWGLAFTAADIDACGTALGTSLGAIRDAVQPGRRIATLRHDAVGLSVPTAFMSP